MQLIQEQLEDLRVRMEKHADQVNQQFRELNKKMEAFDTALLGSLDGRTGLIASEKHSQKSLEQGRERMNELDDRLKSVETWRQYSIGMAAGVAAVISFAVAAIIGLAKYLLSSAK